jgi:hypothetical protein
MEQGHTPGADDVEPADVARFFDDTLPNLVCPACGGGNFDVEYGSDARNAAKAGRLPSVDVTCAKCGCMLPFAYRFIAKWVAARKAGSANG